MAKNTLGFAGNKPRKNTQSQGPVIRSAPQNPDRLPGGRLYEDPAKTEKAGQEIQKILGYDNGNTDSSTYEGQKQQSYQDQTDYIDSQLREQNELGKTLLSEDYKAPTTIEEVIQREKDKLNRDISFQSSQLDAANVANEAEREKMKTQATISSAAIDASFAQGREGAMSGTRPTAAQELKANLSRDVSMGLAQINTTEQRIAMGRQALQEAKQRGSEEQIEMFQNQLYDAERALQEQKTAYNNSLVAASQEARAVNQSMQQSISTFTGIVDSGATMTPQGVLSMAKSLNIPTDIALDYYMGAEEIRNDRSLSIEEKQVALEEVKRDFSLRGEGYVTVESQLIKGITEMVANGTMSQERAQNMFVGLKIPSSMNPFTQIELAQSRANLLAKEIANQYLPQEKELSIKAVNQDLTLGELERVIKEAEAAGAPQRVLLELEQAKLDLKKQKLDYAVGERDYTNELPPAMAMEATLLSGPSKYGHGEGKRECGEAYNQLTNEGGAGDLYSDKMALVVGKSNPSVGNGLVIPLKGAGKYGHIETIISVNSVTNQLQTVSYNRDKKGGQTIQTYNIDELNQQYGDNWGFTGSTLKPEVSEKLQAIAQEIEGPKISEDGSFSVSARKAELINEGFLPDSAQKQAEKEYAENLKSETEGLELSQQQGNIYFGASRMHEAMSTMEDLNLSQADQDSLDSLILRASNDGKITSEGMTDTWMREQNLNEKQRDYLNAASRWINAKLRPESGAAISVSEYMDAKQQFFPTYGDSENSRMIKENARNQVFQDYLDVLPKKAVDKLEGRFQKKTFSEYELGLTSTVETDALTNELF